MSAVSGIQKAVEHFEGSPTRMAAAVGDGVLRQHIEHWLKVGRVPAEHCVAVERATSGKVTRKDLRPEDWRAIWPELAANDTEAVSHD